MDRLLQAALGHIKRGNLQVASAGGAVFSFGDGTGPPIVARFKTAAAQWTALLDPDSYTASFVFGAQAYAGGHDGVIYPSVRRASGTCLGVFRPRCVHNAHTTKYLGYRWNGHRIDDVYELTSLTSQYPDEPGARGT